MHVDIFIELSLLEQCLIFRFIYPVQFLILVAFKIVEIITQWIIHLHNVVRDDRYLIRRQLVNRTE